jgi:hypothetical protein
MKKHTTKALIHTALMGAAWIALMLAIKNILIP